MPSPISIIAHTNAHHAYISFGIKQRDRLQHLYVIGQTGTGKSTLLHRLAMQDIEAGRGVAVIDPHGDLAERLMDMIPPHRQADVVYLNAPDPSEPFGYNPVAKVPDHLVPLAASGLLEAFKKLWHDAWGVRMEHIFRNCLYALIEAGGATLPDILRIITDTAYRAKILTRVTTHWGHASNISSNCNHPSTKAKTSFRR